MAPMAAFKKQRSQDRVLVRETVASRRRQSIEAREHERLTALAWHRQKQEKHQQSTSSKYPKYDIVHLKQIFDAYDIDGSGSIERGELLLALQKQKDAARHFDGSRKSLAERQAERGVVSGGELHNRKGLFLVDFTESLFRAMDANSDGHVEFGELLRRLYPFASESELQTMLGWVAPAPEPTLEEYELTGEQRREIKSMFNLYDKDRSGTISPAEFRQAMKRCGYDATETDELFAEADIDGSNGIDLDEFTELMRQTLFNGERLSFSMLYGPI